MRSRIRHSLLLSILFVLLLALGLTLPARAATRPVRPTPARSPFRPGVVANSVCAAAHPSTSVTTINVGCVPQGVAVNPRLHRAYVANTFSNSVSAINTRTNSVVATIPVGNHPFWLRST